MPFNCRKSEQLSLILPMKEHHALQILKCCSEVLFLQHLPNGPFQNGVRPLGNVQTCRYQYQITVLCCRADPLQCIVTRSPQWRFSTLLTWIAATKRSSSVVNHCPLVDLCSYMWTALLSLTCLGVWLTIDRERKSKRIAEITRNWIAIRALNHNRAERTQGKSADKRAVSAKFYSLNKLLAGL